MTPSEIAEQQAADALTHARIAAAEAAGEAAARAAAAITASAQR